MKCIVPSCNKQTKNRKYCWGHYYRLYRYGTLQSSKPIGKYWINIPAEKRFWMHVKKTKTCWIWTAGKNYAGYGHFIGNNKNRWLAHRYAYTLLVGKIPKGLTLDHQCRNTSCVNPEHLKPMTIKENILKGNGAAAINKRKTQCPQGHPYKGNNLIIRKSGSRRCRTCTNNSAKEYQRQKRAKSRITCKY